MVLLFTYGAPTPTAIDDFCAFVAALGAPELAALVARAEPIGEPATYAFPRSTRAQLATLQACLDAAADCDGARVCAQATASPIADCYR